MSGKVGEARWPGLARWSLAAFVVAVAHGGLALLALEWRVSEASAGASQPAVLIELAAVSVAPEAPAEPLLPAPAKTEPAPPTPEPVVEPPPPEPPPPEPPPPERPPPEPVQTSEPPPEPEPVPIPVEAPPPEIKLPELPPIPDAAAVLAPPPPPPPPRAREVVRKPPPPKPRVVERRPVERERPRARQAAAPPPSARASAPSVPSPGAEATPSVSPASWRGTLIAHLNRYKRFPGGARPGTAQVAFSIDRSGRVLMARLAGSSGDPALDEEAVAMIRRASPVPAPPTGVGGAGSITLAVPVRFTR